MDEDQFSALEKIGLTPTDLAGQVVVVTGAGRGIGREMARAFGWMGAKVVIAEISDTGQETESHIRQAGGEALFIHTDVSSVEDVNHLAKMVSTAYGPVDILVNDAIICPVASLQELNVELWDRVMAVNLRGVFLTCKTFLEEMLEREKGVILNLVSTDAMPYLSAYMASKQGILAFSQSLAAEVAQKNIQVIAFAPGFVDTPGLRQVAENLAPGLGMSTEQFMRLSFHPAYVNEAMPADHAAVAAGYLVARLAAEYHGELVTGYTILERAGLISAPLAEERAETTPVDAQKGNETLLGFSDQEALAQPAAASVEPETTVPSRTVLLGRAQELALGLNKTLADTEAEFNKLPIFVRPLARSGFKNKSGQSLQDWGRTARALVNQLKAAAASEREETGLLEANLPRLKDLLEKLLVYYREVPSQTARFSNDAEFLKEVKQIASERVGLIRSLITVLEALAGREIK
jgi:NAD(P)-dependent dehydrogenase (short-subunit alcohol dehydrogenase family)